MAITLRTQFIRVDAKIERLMSSATRNQAVLDSLVRERSAILESMRVEAYYEDVARQAQADRDYIASRPD